MKQLFYHILISTSLFLILVPKISKSMYFTITISDWCNNVRRNPSQPSVSTLASQTNTTPPVHNILPQLGNEVEETLTPTQRVHKECEESTVILNSGDEQETLTPTQRVLHESQEILTPTQRVYKKEEEEVLTPTQRVGVQDRAERQGSFRFDSPIKRQERQDDCGIRRKGEVGKRGVRVRDRW